MRFESLSTLDHVIGGLLCGLFAPAAARPQGAVTASPPRRALLVKLRGIGDIILAMPMMRALKERGTRIAFLTGPANAAWMAGQELIDDLLVVDFQRVWRSVRLLSLLRRLRGLGIDAFIDLTQSAHFPSLLGLGSRAPVRIGFANRSPRKRRRNRLYTHAVPFSGREHMAACYFDLLRPFAIPRPEPLRLTAPSFSAADSAAVSAFLGGSRGMLAGIHFSGAIVAKRWPFDGWAALCRHLFRRGYTVIAVGGAGERQEVERLAAALNGGGGLVNAAGRLTLSQVFALMPRLRLFVANDGGPMHIAAAAGVPTLGLFGAEVPWRYSPLNDASLALYRGGDLPCSPCSRPYEGAWPTCRRPLCMEAITVADVLRAVGELEGKAAMGPAR
jgi:ADP-heptose:LPS heptosyltransferase